MRGAKLGKPGAAVEPLVARMGGKLPFQERYDLARVSLDGGLKPLSRRGSPELERTITLGGSALLSFNGLVGAAIFALPATLLIQWGTLSPWLFLAVGIGALVVIIPFARSAAKFPESGGPATYGLVFGRLTGFEMGWLYYVSKVAGIAANLNVLADYIAAWLTLARHGPGRAITLAVLCAVLTALNALGIKRALAFLGGFTVLKALPLVIVSIAALLLFGPPPSPDLATRPTALEAGLLVIFYAFVGFENAVLPAGETQNPDATLPRAIILTTLLTALLYFMIQLGFITAFQERAVASNAPLIELGGLVFGWVGAIALTLTAIFALLGNLLSGCAAAPRATYAMGVRGDLPRWFGAVSPKFKSPANSIVFMGIAVAGLALSGGFVWLAVVATLARLIVYAVTIAALPLVSPKRLRAADWLSGALGVAVCLWAMTQADAKAWLTLLPLCIVGAALYAVTALASKRASNSLRA